MTDTADLSGSCLCGAVGFDAKGVETHVHACHCSTCRNWSGSPMLAAGAESVTFTGEEHIRRYDSSEWASRGFCTLCGTNLFYYLKPGDRYIMCTGAFDDAEAFQLAGEIYVDEKPAGYDFAGEHERLTGEQFLANMQV